MKTTLDKKDFADKIRKAWAEKSPEELEELRLRRNETRRRNKKRKDK